MTEADLDRGKAHFNHLHVHLNSRQFALTPTASGWRRSSAHAAAGSDVF
jgi:hypothetical protein